MPPCPLTGVRQFGGAFKCVLADPALAKRVHEIVVNRTWPEATIVYNEGRSRRRSRFVDEIARQLARRRLMSGGLQTFCTLGAGPLHEIAKALVEKDE